MGTQATSDVAPRFSKQSASGTRRQRIRRFNHAVLNPIMLRVADWRHGTYPAIVNHLGRRSGTPYRTPVVAQPITGGFVIPLPYGRDTDWLRNVLATGHFRLERAGHISDIAALEIIAADEALPLVPVRLQRVWRRFGITEFLCGRVCDPGAAARVAANRESSQAAPTPITTSRTSAFTAGAREEIMEQENAKRRSERVTGVSNVAYDLMVVLTNKLEGVAAMEDYKLDADAANDPEVRAAFERIEQRERECIEELRGLLMARLQRIQVS
jgi:deazaflavin-dependent oxidoreductase (nitroreductase family)